ncbi:hypothetical protein ASPBRDRAFT_192793 [Aspergillus brasiliensis CBS 101740]|uniref:Uncharacterized protein n=1 Tax=Aspergillus brasiliensis (strain CBS 101740 / IMI 381727 / IBT 21946) TaxID=767769 RepID=A0A1L9UY99_ASPBC|nr:hypothetical protein ASPBRDRAFT_192793 [Aspergillus brasiliensis CBS 101740]
MAHKITVTLPQLAKMIDHSLLHPTMTDADLICRPQNRPFGYWIPHGNSTTEIKVLEASAAAKAGGAEINIMINVGKVLGGDWEYVVDEICQVNDAVVANGAVLKVIFENDYLRSEHIARLCEICTRIGVAFVKTSTGYRFVKQSDGLYNYKGATVPALKLMREKSGEKFRRYPHWSHGYLAILEDAQKRGMGNEPVEVEFEPMAES